ncbi:CheR family methyltransferase [Sulfurospirillum arcachonense]|uniref:CheR family methyltransferase n=1 Tax=Sulfurospirillum arcachonense TaxID=57666 RepID=UPI000468638D|nr:protein-glutamate O-methyltransferase CheR [Sulfurospirillum arcachonense]
MKIKKQEFQNFQQLIYKEFGISLSDRKTTLVQSRLRKWVQKLNLRSYQDLYEYFLNDTSELYLLADAITTNVTSFFREANQWQYLKTYLSTCTEKKLRIWSGACSSGQEPYTIAIFLKENLKDFNAWDIKILATDLSKDILKKAMKGEYSQKEVEGLTKTHLQKYFLKSGETYKIKQEIKDMIIFKSFNLVTGNYSIFKNKFNLIFCRNVMIYFDKKTQYQVINKLKNLLSNKSLLLLGQSESITEPVQSLQIVTSSIYQKKV